MNFKVHVYIIGLGWVYGYCHTPDTHIVYGRDRECAQAFDVGPEVESLKVFITERLKRDYRIYNAMDAVTVEEEHAE